MAEFVEDVSAPGQKLPLIGYLAANANWRAKYTNLAALLVKLLRDSLSKWLYGRGHSQQQNEASERNQLLPNGPLSRQSGPIGLTSSQL